MNLIDVLNILENDFVSGQDDNRWLDDGGNLGPDPYLAYSKTPPDLSSTPTYPASISQPPTQPGWMNQSSQPQPTQQWYPPLQNNTNTPPGYTPGLHNNPAYHMTNYASHFFFALSDEEAETLAWTDIMDKNGVYNTYEDAVTAMGSYDGKVYELNGTTGTIHFLGRPIRPVSLTRCECGADSVGSNRHAEDYCPKYKKA